MMEKPMSMLVECEECKQKFEINSGTNANQVIHKREYKIERQSIFLTYYDCPSCGRRHFVQVDDVTSLGMLSKVERQFVVLAAAKKKDKEIPQKQSAKFKKARKDLSKYRMGLMQKYTGKEVCGADGFIFTLRFSV